MRSWHKNWQKMRTTKEKLCLLYLTVTRMFISIAQTNRIHLGTNVVFKGKKMYVSNGHGRKRWTLREKPPMTEEDVDDFIFAYEDEFKKIVSFENIKNDSMSWWDWYKTSWLDIDASAMARGETLCSIRILGKNRAHGKEI